MQIYELLPKAKDCVRGHIGKPIETLYAEVNDDRYDYIVFDRCSHCDIPISGDRYATDEDIARLS